MREKKSENPQTPERIAGKNNNLIFMTMPKEEKKNQQKTWPLSIPKRGCLFTIVQVEHNLPERRKQKKEEGRTLKHLVMTLPTGEKRTFAVSVHLHWIRRRHHRVLRGRDGMNAIAHVKHVCW
jgi:hypothetical protein